MHDGVRYDVGASWVAAADVGALRLDDSFQQLTVEGSPPLAGSRWDVFCIPPRDPARPSRREKSERVKTKILSWM